jgi:hypothetical protein
MQLINKKHLLMLESHLPCLKGCPNNGFAACPIVTSDNIYNLGVSVCYCLASWAHKSIKKEHN